MATDQIEEIKSKVDLVSLISGYLPLKKAGRNFIALCPFHSEKTPSFAVSPERQIWKCFGCGIGGDAFKFLMKMENIEFGEALRELAQKAGIKLVDYRSTTGEREKQIIYEINHLAAEFYHYLLIEHPVGKKALNYILGRGISVDSLKLFRIGYSPPLWEGCQKYLTAKKGYSAPDLEKAGLVIRGKGTGHYDRFRDRLMFPLRDHRGNVCGFAGRVLTPTASEAKYINTPETLVYHKSDLLFGLFEAKDAIKKADEAVLVEGELDMISSFQAGIKNAVAIKGSALTPSQIKLLSRFTFNLVLALDQDVAGDKAARRGIELAEGTGMLMKVVEIKGGKDPDEVAQKQPELWRKLVAEAIPFYDFLIDSACSRFDPVTVAGEKKIAQEIVPALAKITDEILRARYIAQLAQRLGVDEEAVSAEVQKAAGKIFPIASVKIKKENFEDQEEMLEKHLLALGFQSGKWEWLTKKEILNLIRAPRWQRILSNLADYLKEFKTYKSERLAKVLAPELKESFNQLYLVDLGDILEDEEMLEKDFQTTLERIRDLGWRRELNALSAKIKSLEKKAKLEEKEKEELDILGEKFRDLSGKLLGWRKER